MADGIFMIKNILILFSLLFVLFVFFPSQAEAHLPALHNQTSLAPMLKNVMPAVVNISVEAVKLTRLDELVPNVENNSTKVPVKSYTVGSGVIFDAQKGLIITNAHVVQHEKTIVVTLKDGRRYLAKMLAKDDDYDIAILQIHAKHLTNVTFANSDRVKVGDFVTAIGSPYGLSQTVTSGVVSAINRSHPQIEGYQSFIQTDAPINPGNSGGALVNMQGQIIGINTAMVAPSDGNIGIGFAIPSNMVQSVAEQLLKYGKVERGILGVIVQNITPALQEAMHLATTQCALISQVLPNTPAEMIKLKPQDIITKIDQHNIRSADQLKNTLGLIRPKTPITLTIIRNHNTLQLKAVVGDPKKISEKKIPYFSGVRMQDLNEFESDGTRLKGLLVTDISSNSEAGLAGLTPGDVLIDINGSPVTGMTDLEKIIQQNTSRRPLLLTVRRGNSNFYLVMRAE